jgi:DNA integrity scanning protein DisA with diadenylate cyclase activity
LDCLDKLPTDEIPKTAKDLILIPVTQRTPKDLTNMLQDQTKPLKHGVVHLPPVNMTRMSHIKISVVHAISKGLINIGDKIVFVTGVQGSKELDSIILLDTGTESEIMTTHGAQAIAENISQEVFQVVLNLSLELAHRGREGKPVGTIFVLGDEERVMQLSKQMVINPFRGSTEEESNILNPHLKETIREFSAIDGAFIISSDGHLLAAGRYLNAASEEESIPRGLGSRHIAAGGITALTNAVAIVIAESSGDVRIFKDGKILMEIEKSPSPKTA